MSIILALLLLCLCLGAWSQWGGGMGWGYYGWSPLGVVIVVALVLYFMGVVR